MRGCHVRDCIKKLTKSLPLMPLNFPAACCCSFAFLTRSASASFLANLVIFHFANDSSVTGVRLLPSLCRLSRNRVSNACRRGDSVAYLDFQEVF